MLYAIVRDVSKRIGECVLCHLQREAIDIDLARVQHQAYVERLVELGCQVQTLPAEPDLPDCVFVEDTAVVLDELAIIARPGAPSRRPETRAVIEALRQHRALCCVRAPGTLDGGDVLRLGRTLFIGLSRRTNRAGVQRVRDAVSTYGYRVVGVPVENCLHLKSAVTQVAPNTLLINRDWVDAGWFSTAALIDVHPEEPFAANALLVNSTVIYPSHYPATLDRLHAQGIDVRTTDISELAKAEGGVTCCSLILDASVLE